MKDDYGRDNYKLAIQGSVEDLRTKEGITYIYDEEVLKGLLKKI